MNINDFVKDHVTVTSYDQGIKYSFQPGNGWKYEIFVTHIPGSFSLGEMGGINSGFLIVSGWNQVSYLFADNKAYLTSDYIAEKMFPKNNCLNTSNNQAINCITALIGWVLQRETDITELEQMGAK